MRSRQLQICSAGRRALSTTHAQPPPAAQASCPSSRGNCLVPQFAVAHSNGRCRVAIAPRRAQGEEASRSERERLAVINGTHAELVAFKARLSREHEALLEDFHQQQALLAKLQAANQQKTAELERYEQARGHGSPHHFFLPIVAIPS